jgi:hypothetical protein
MPLFRVVLRGDNFPGVILAQADPIGFYTTRFVEAESAAEAELAALAILRSDPAMKVAAEHRTASASVHIEELSEVAMSTERKSNAGFTFFPMAT